MVLGAIFLIHRLDPSFPIGHMARFYWPLLFVVWGVAKLIDHFVSQSSGQERAPLLSAGEALLLILLIFVLLGFGIHDVVRERAPWLHIDIPEFRDKYSSTREVQPRDIPANAHVTIETQRGGITVHGGGSQLHVTATESANGDDESSADARMKDVEISVEKSGDGFTVRPVHQSDDRGIVAADLEVQLPKTVSLTLHTSHGDVSVNDIGGAIDARTENGDVEIHDAGADVAAQTEKGDVRIDRAAGNVTVKGRGGNVEISDVTANVTIDGAFVGTNVVRKVGGLTRLAAPWAQLSIAQLSGRLEIDSGDIHISDAAGAARIQTHNKDIEIENVAGQLDITNSHADVKVTLNQPPREAVNITNDSGQVEVSLPSRSSFQVSAYSRSGEVESDFSDPGLHSSGEEENNRIEGQVGAKPGMPMPKITISTSYGTVSLRKSS
jgi:Putative adhesin